MSSSRFKTKLLLAAPLLLMLPLAGCGEGYEMTAYSGFPYNNERTAGHGVAYVRASMLPQRGPVIEAAQPENTEIIEAPQMATEQPVMQEAPLEETKEILKNMNDAEAEKLFNEKQRK